MEMPNCRHMYLLDPIKDEHLRSSMLQYKYEPIVSPWPKIIGNPLIKSINLQVSYNIGGPFHWSPGNWGPQPKNQNITIAVKGLSIHYDHVIVGDIMQSAKIRVAWNV
jgi:hypothetical protein